MISDSVVLPLLLMMQYAAAEYCAIRRKRARRSGVIPRDSVLTRVASRERTRAKVTVLKEQHRLMTSVVQRVNFAMRMVRKGEKRSEGCGNKSTADKGGYKRSERD